MPRQQKIERNKRLVELRNKDPRKWTFPALAKEFNITKQTAHELYYLYLKSFPDLSTRK